MTSTAVEVMERVRQESGDPDLGIKVIRTCPRCHQRYHQFTRRGPTRSKRFIACVQCGHEWLGRVTKFETGEL